MTYDQRSGPCVPDNKLLFIIKGGNIDVQDRQALLQKVLRKNVKLYDIVEENCRKDHGFGSRRKIGF